MRTERNRSGQLPRALAGRAPLVAALVLLAAFLMASAAAAQEAPPAGGGPDSPRGLPPENFSTSPHRGVIDGSGRTIPCRCRFNGKAYRLGEIVCMTTHVGTVLTRCDIFENNTSWIPSRQPCVPDAGT